MPTRGNQPLDAPPDDLGDAALTALIFVAGIAPLALAVARVGTWSSAALGAGTAGAVLAGRELVGRLAYFLRARVQRPPARVLAGPGAAARDG